MNNFTIKFGLQKAENRGRVAAKPSKITVPMPRQLPSQHSSHYQSYLHISGFQNIVTLLAIPTKHAIYTYVSSL